MNHKYDNIVRNRITYDYIHRKINAQNINQ
jgi:hypothetical protein